MKGLHGFFGLIGLLLVVSATAEETTGPEVLDLGAFPVYAGSWAEEGMDTGGQLSERMEREVRVDLQSRGGSRYQADISIRGGIFEGTGLMVGGLALFDPQTGHYFSEIPLDPVFFSGARLLTGVNNALYGFNATAGSIDWEWAGIREGGGLGLALGTDRMWGFSAYQGGALAGDGGWQMAVQRESGDGSVKNGDFDLKRISARFEWQAGPGVLRIFGGFVDKFYGWPGMYTGIAALNETDAYTVGLAGFQWERRMERGHHRIGGYWRQLDNDYEFNRENPNRLFEHLTEVWSLQGDGLMEAGTLDIAYRWALLRDRVIRSTSLVHGQFNERDYAEGAFRVERRQETKAGELTPYAGFGIDTTNEEATVLLPLAGLRLSGATEAGSWQVYSAYSQASQVPGYTVLNSAPEGLFGGNSELGREKAETLEAGVQLERGPLSGRAVFFRREDTDLVDWVFEQGSPSAREASAMDSTVDGVEAGLRWDGESLELELGYSYLDKEQDYADAGGDASFYALNYARHRLLATVEWFPLEGLALRLEGEWREQRENPLRTGPDTLSQLNLGARWEDAMGSGWDLLMRVDNLNKVDFQRIPGTPGPGREAQVMFRRLW